jgi:hypothetical protein
VLDVLAKRLSGVVLYTPGYAHRYWLGIASATSFAEKRIIVDFLLLDIV